MTTTSHPYPDELSRLRRAGDEFARLVADVPDDGLNRLTPCPSWSVRHLVTHVISICDQLVPLALDRAPEPLSTPQQSISELDYANRITAAVAAGADAWESVHLSGLREFPWGPTPAVRAVQYTIIELAGHGWDLAQALELQPRFRDDDIHATIRVVQRHLPDELRPGNFQPSRRAPAEATPLDALAAALGRGTWVPATPA